MVARAERERVVESVFEKWNRPGPTRPGPTGHFGHPGFRTEKARFRHAGFGQFWCLFRPGPARPGPAWPAPARPGLARPGLDQSSPIRPDLVGFGGFGGVLVGIQKVW